MRRLIPVLLASHFLAGCGSESVQQFSGPNGTNSLPLNQTQPTGQVPAPGGGLGDSPEDDDPGTIRGQVLLDKPLVGATIKIYSGNTEVHLTGNQQTGNAGFFDVASSNNTTLADFRVVASKDGESYAAEVRGFTRPGRVLVTPLTNLVAAAYYKLNPNRDPHGSLDPARAEVRTILHLPANFDLDNDMGTIAHRGGFVASRYLIDARLAGNNGSSDGVSNFVNQLVNATTPYKPPLPPIPDASNARYSDDGSAFWEQQALQLGAAVITTALLDAEVPGGVIIGWVLSALVGNIGSGDPMDQLIEALAEEIALLVQEVARVEQALSSEISDATFSDAFAITRNAVYGPIQDARNRFTNTMSGGASYEARQEVATNVTSANFTGVLNTIHSDQMSAAGVPGLIQLCQNTVRLSTSGFYTNQLDFNPLQSEYAYFAGLQTQAVNLIVDGFHGLDAGSADTARLWHDRYKQNLAEQASALPQPLGSDEVVFVRGPGLLVYRRSPRSSRQEYAERDTIGFKLGPFTHWRVASKRDYEDIRGRDRLDYSQLNSLGFEMANIKIFEEDKRNPYYYGTSSGGRFAFGSDGSNFDDPAAWQEDGPFSFLMVANLDRDFTPAKYRSFIPLGNLKSIKVSRSGDRLTASGHYTLKLDRQDKSMDVDITDLVSWSSDNPDKVRVQNPPAVNVSIIPGQPNIDLTPGAITGLQGANSSANVTATAYDPFSPGLPRIAGTLQVSMTPGPVTTDKVLVSPKNYIIEAAPSVTNLTPQLFYSNGTSRITATNVSWSVSSGANGTNPLDTKVAEVRTINNQTVLNLYSKPTGTELWVTGTAANGVKDSTKFFLLIP